MINVNLLNKPGLQKEETKSESLSFIEVDDKIDIPSSEVVFPRLQFNSFFFILILLSTFVLIVISYYLEIL